MRIPQIFMLLALISILTNSCGNRHSRKDNLPIQEDNTPSTKELQKLKSDPNEKNKAVPNRNYQDSILKKRKKSRGLDSLKPKVAMMGT
ncbi:hypothetical protein HPE56_11155 [Maribacter sp. ANRC-HE7]|uniref:Lipoprotein n=1 Tax=Maribacter aquimaris TaxID=2737171 RepID=A0ABR7V5B2_9FLAO|nr:hypothetical protein [Maribacter aquimaris]MBD0778352.1 hypothetical protein [Maribacter aquimaris]